MTENVKHVEVLRKLQAAIFLPSDKTLTELEAEQIRALDAAILSLQREAAGDGEVWAPSCQKCRMTIVGPSECAIGGQHCQCTAPRPTGTDKVARLPELWERAANTTIGTDDASETQRRILQMCADHLRAALTTPASAEPPLFEDRREALRELWSGVPLDEVKKMRDAYFSDLNPDARGGGEAVWIDRADLEAMRSGRRYKSVVFAEAFDGDCIALRTHPAPAALDAEWTDVQCIAFMATALRHVEYKRGNKGPSCDDIRLGVKFAARATTGGHGNG